MLVVGAPGQWWVPMPTCGWRRAPGHVLAASARGEPGPPKHSKGVQQEPGYGCNGLASAQGFPRAQWYMRPLPHTPCSVTFWAALSCVGYFCTEHLGVQVMLGLIPSPLDLFSYGKVDFALFPSFISPVLSLREPWGWGVPWAGDAGTPWGVPGVLGFGQRWLCLVFFLLP